MLPRQVGGEGLGFPTQLVEIEDRQITRISELDDSTVTQYENDPRIEVHGRMREERVAMHAGFVAHGARAYQWVVLGGAPDPEQVRTFLDSFRLTDCGR